MNGAESGARAGLRITWLGLWINLVLVALKVAAGLLAGSRAVLADAAHSLSDLISDGLVLVALRVGAAPGDRTHPYGHGKFESLGALGVAMLLGLVAAGIFLDALRGALAGAHPAPGALALAVTVLSIGSKEWLFQATARTARRLQSDALLANAWHHRSDALSSVAVLAGLICARLGLPMMDPVAACLVAALVGHAAWRIGRRSVGKLTDEMLSVELLDTLKERAGRVPGVQDVHDLRARWMGSRILVDLHLLVPDGITASEGHRIGEKVRADLMRDHPGVAEVIVHVEPEEHGAAYDLGPSRREIHGLLTPVIRRFPEVRCWRLRQVHFLAGEARVDLDLCLPEGRTLAEAEEAGRRVAAAVEEIPRLRAGRIAFAAIPPSRVDGGAAAG